MVGDRFAYAGQTMATDPLSEERIWALPPSDAIVALRPVPSEGGQAGVDDDIELFLPFSDQPSLVLGSLPMPEVDVSLPRQGVSRRHVSLSRRGNALWVIDNESTNGTFYRGRREREFAMLAGETFRVGDVELLALDRYLLALRPLAQWCLGYRAHRAVAELLMLAAQDRAILLGGAPGCDQDRLADGIHRASARRGGPFIVYDPSEPIRSIARASKGTLFVPLRTNERLTGTKTNPEITTHVIQCLFSSDYQVRSIVSIQHVDKLEEIFGAEAERRFQFGYVRVPSVAERAEEIPRLFDELIQEELRAKQILPSAVAHGPRSIRELGPERVSALQRYHWEGNFPALRRAFVKLYARLIGGSLVEAARLLGCGHSALSNTFERLGFPPER